MMNEIFKTQLLIVGLVDYLLETLGADSARKDIRRDLLAAVQADLGARLLQRPEISERLKTALSHAPPEASVHSILARLPNLANQGSASPPVLARCFKEAAVAVLGEFAGRSSQPQLAEAVKNALA